MKVRKRLMAYNWWRERTYEAARGGPKRAGGRQTGGGKRGLWKEATGNPGYGRMDLQRKLQGGSEWRRWREQLNIVLSQAPMEATFKCASAMSGCRIT